ncbi:L-threonylcarbamoyladenylate synthase [Myxococcus xanthus]|uniref:Threonylcarbamoyl-AMP synthase n=1 Tax=Myxococcus xanthus TaxID=34 RepID=A0AAE6KWR0_MYXXA|nr:L-threonylcarbamoyladenylate synthase [Myxococcus xanthus]QDE72325.1 threonylcarbamoyl-AMP synthase [Myxococcus xanthus]QDE79608.1 threonylcarbamoyl-AMP synthase [Myxococcus xanthus]QDE81430.1 threonylcarbamoyl-AMP synthase [Myxococcus xanthus]
MIAPESLERAVELLRHGGVVALPTETVYGLSANAEDELAVRRVFAIKGRPATHPLIVHIPGVEHLDTWAREVPEAARKLAEAFWPGPLTLVLPRTARATDAVTGGQDTVALRVPNHPVALAVLQKLGGGLAAPSANRFGKVSPTTAEHVREDLGGDVDLVLDGGPCTVGVESTIVDLSSDEPAILRPGGLAVEDVERVLGHKVPVRTSSKVRVSGSLESHYAPRAGVVLTEPAQAVARVQELRGQGLRVGVLGPASLALPPDVSRFDVPDEPAGAARVLYARLREADAQGHDVLVACLPAESGLGIAVRDRLSRAAAPRG